MDAGLSRKTAKSDLTAGNFGHCCAAAPASVSSSSHSAMRMAHKGVITALCRSILVSEVCSELLYRKFRIETNQLFLFETTFQLMSDWRKPDLVVLEPSRDDAG